MASLAPQGQPVCRSPGETPSPAGIPSPMPSLLKNTLSPHPGISRSKSGCLSSCAPRGSRRPATLPRAARSARSLLRSLLLRWRSSPRLLSRRRSRLLVCRRSPLLDRRRSLLPPRSRLSLLPPRCRSLLLDRRRFSPRSRRCSLLRLRLRLVPLPRRSSLPPSFLAAAAAAAAPAAPAARPGCTLPPRSRCCSFFSCFRRRTTAVALSLS